MREHVAVNGEYRRLALDLPDGMPRAHPGQFYHLLCPITDELEPFFRRPMSVYEIGADARRIGFLYKLTGAGTAAMAGLRPGDAFDVFGPLGIGFSLPEERAPIVLLGRGVGLATMGPLVPWARENGHPVTAILSARAPDLLMSVDDMRAAGATVIPVTDVDQRALAERIFADVAAMSPDAVGLSRPAYSEVESRTLDYLENTARRLGLATWRDAGENLVIAAPGDTDPATRAGYFGSHVDTVPEGGNFDGLAGVVAALLSLHTNVRDGTSGRVPLRVLALRGEESAWFGRAYMGSLALFGRLTPAALAAKRRDGVGTLADAMTRTGLPVARIAAGEPLCDPKAFAFFVELHIEQGPVLVDRKWPIAGVTGIRGNIRYREIRCVGEAGHSGTVPRWLRRDAVFAMCELVMRMDEHWATIQQHGGDLVLTTGIVQTDPAHHAMSRIPGEVTFSLEARSLDAGTLEAVERLAHAEARAIERDRGVRFDFDEPVRSAPASLDPAILQAFLVEAEEEKLPAETIPSGAGHDTAVFAQAGVPSGLIFVRNTKGSHNPDEHMEIDDLMLAVGVMTRLGKTLVERAR